MKRIYWILIFLFTTMFASAQDNWTIKLNGKILLTTNTENVKANIKRIKCSELKKKGTLDILIKDSNPRPDWKRTLFLVDDNHEDLIEKDSITEVTKINNSNVRKQFAGKKRIRIYTIAIPTDPNLAAAIRVRRVHLCTLELQ